MPGGPLSICRSGQPFLWPNGGLDIPFNVDQGELGPLDHAAAVAAVSAALGRWTDVSTSSASYLAGPELPVDVDVSSFVPYFFGPPDGLSPVIFDDTGEIFDLLFGPGSGILGIAGIDWGDSASCEVSEGAALLNGRDLVDQTAAEDVMVHEFGHYSGLDHTVVNGLIFVLADPSGPWPHNTFGYPTSLSQVETMFPLYFGPGSGFASPARDDAAAISALYPEPGPAGFLATTGSVAGAVLLGSGRITGVNVIARNVADPFDDAVSAISGGLAHPLHRGDPRVGTYRLSGLTPGASYAVYIDQIPNGAFHVPSLPLWLFGPEEFYNAGESNDVLSEDDPSEFTALTAAPGNTVGNVNVIFNTFGPGEPLPVAFDGEVALGLPFPFKLCGQEYGYLFASENGNLTFGAPGFTFAFFETVDELLGGPPRLAALWENLLETSEGGLVTYQQTANTFTVRWEGVPESEIGGSNTFSITLKRPANQVIVTYGELSASGGVAGLSCGGEATSRFEAEQPLRTSPHRRTIDLRGHTAAYEIFTESDNDLDGYELTFVNFKTGFTDVFEPNDDLAHATPIHLPFNTSSVPRFSHISPDGADADYYRFPAQAGDILAIEVVRATPGLDSVIGLFDADTGELLAVDDNGSPSGFGLSRLFHPVERDMNLALAVGGLRGGRYVLAVNRYRGEVLDLGDDTTTELSLGSPFRFQGQTRASVFVNSNGNLTFGAGDVDPGDSIADFLAGPPRIAPLWDDLDPRFGLVIAERGTNHTTIHYVSVPHFELPNATNYFSVRLLPLGVIRLEYGPTYVDHQFTASLVGVTEGGGAADPGETNLTARRLPAFPANGTTYQRFVYPDPFDLSFSSLLFVPF